MRRSEYEFYSDNDPLLVAEWLRGTADTLALVGHKVVGISLIQRDLSKDYVGIIWYQTDKPDLKLSETKIQNNFGDELKRVGALDDTKRIEDENVNRAYRESISANRRTRS